MNVMVMQNLKQTSVLYGYEKQQSELSKLVQNFCVRKEGSSVLLIGPPKSGKTSLLNKVLDSVLPSHGDGESCISVVRLNGFVHTDDRLSLGSVASQLSQRLQDSLAGPVSYLESMKHILDLMERKDDKESSVIFVVEEFDLFAAHHNQTLLYTLLDITHNSARYIPVCVIGLSCRPDVVDLLEKRVRSRLSPLQIKLNNEWSLEEYMGFAGKLLTMKEIPGKSRRPNPSDAVQRWNRDVKMIVIAQMWDETLLLSEIFAGKKQSGGVFLDLTKDYREDILRDVSLVEVCILIGIKHLCSEDHAESFNFEMVFLEFRKFQNKKEMMLKCSKSLLLKAFENLESLEVIRPISDSYGKHLQKSFRLMNAQFDLRILKKILDEKDTKYPASIKNWYSNRL